MNFTKFNHLFAVFVIFQIIMPKSELAFDDELSSSSHSKNSFKMNCESRCAFLPPYVTRASCNSICGICSLIFPEFTIITDIDDDITEIMSMDDKYSQIMYDDNDEYSENEWNSIFNFPKYDAENFPLFLERALKPIIMKLAKLEFRNRLDEIRLSISELKKELLKRIVSIEKRLKSGLHLNMTIVPAQKRFSNRSTYIKDIFYFNKGIIELERLNISKNSKAINKNTTIRHGKNRCFGRSNISSKEFYFKRTFYLNRLENKIISDNLSSNANNSFQNVTWNLNNTVELFNFNKSRNTSDLIKSTGKILKDSKKYLNQTYKDFYFKEIVLHSLKKINKSFDKGERSNQILTENSNTANVYVNVSESLGENRALNTQKSSIKFKRVKKLNKSDRNLYFDLIFHLNKSTKLIQCLLISLNKPPNGTLNNKTINELPISNSTNLGGENLNINLINDTKLNNSNESLVGIEDKIDSKKCSYQWESFILNSVYNFPYCLPRPTINKSRLKLNFNYTMPQIQNIENKINTTNRSRRGELFINFKNKSTNFIFLLKYLNKSPICRSRIEKLKSSNDSLKIESNINNNNKTAKNSTIQIFKDLKYKSTNFVYFLTKLVNKWPICILKIGKNYFNKKLYSIKTNNSNKIQNKHHDINNNNYSSHFFIKNMNNKSMNFAYFLATLNNTSPICHLKTKSRQRNVSQAIMTQVAISKIGTSVFPNLFKNKSINFRGYLIYYFFNRKICKTKKNISRKSILQYKYLYYIKKYN